MEKNGIWSQTFQIDAASIDKYRKANFKTIGTLFQEVAGGHAFERKVDYFSMREKGLQWVLNRLRIEMVEFPEWRDTVVVSTWVSEMTPFSHRHYEIRRVDGTLLGGGASLWLPLDVVTNRPKRFTDFDVQIVDKETYCKMPSKLKASIDTADMDTAFLPTKKFVEYSDLDMLSHVNNTKYVEWMLNNFHHNSSELFAYKTMEINYLNEVRFGENVEIIPIKQPNSLIYSIQKVVDKSEVCRCVFS